MKFYILIFAIGFVQMCSGRSIKFDEESEGSVAQKIQAYLKGSDSIKDISPKFVENVNTVVEKYQNNIVVTSFLMSIMQLLSKNLDGKNSKINVTTVNNFRRRQHSENGEVIDEAYVLKSLLSQQLPPEPVNGVVNLILMVRKNATETEIENALGYLYDTEAEPMTIDNVEPLSEQECLKESYVGTIGIVLWMDMDAAKKFFKNHTNINPKVIEDMSVVAKKLSCNIYISQFLTVLMNKLIKFAETDPSELDVCNIRNERKPLPSDAITRNIIAIETTLSTRFTDRDLTQLMNLFRFFIIKTTDNEFKSSLAYIYGTELFEKVPVHELSQCTTNNDIQN